MGIRACTQGGDRLDDVVAEVGAREHDAREERAGDLGQAADFVCEPGEAECHRQRQGDARIGRFDPGMVFRDQRHHPSPDAKGQQREEDEFDQGLADRSRLGDDERTEDEHAEDIIDDCRAHDDVPFAAA